MLVEGNFVGVHVFVHCVADLNGVVEEMAENWSFSSLRRSGQPRALEVVEDSELSSMVEA
jgi:hypothetical protein